MDANLSLGRSGRNDNKKNEDSTSSSRSSSTPPKRGEVKALMLQKVVASVKDFEILVRNACGQVIFREELHSLGAPLDVNKDELAQSQRTQEEDISRKTVTEQPHSSSILRPLDHASSFKTRVTSKPSGIEVKQTLEQIYLEMEKFRMEVADRYSLIKQLPIEQLPHNLLLNLKFLTTLNLSQTLIFEFPSSIGDIKSLRHLDVSYTPITGLPESFGSLHKLQTLNLEGCVNLVWSPEGVKELIKLQYPDVTDCQKLKLFPSRDLGKQTLKLISAEIESLPECVEVANSYSYGNTDIDLVSCQVSTVNLNFNDEIAESYTDTEYSFNYGNIDCNYSEVDTTGDEELKQFSKVLNKTSKTRLIGAQLIWCPHCESLLPVFNYTRFRCGGCGAVIKARRKRKQNSKLIPFEIERLPESVEDLERAKKLFLKLKQTKEKEGDISRNTATEHPMMAKGVKEINYVVQVADEEKYHSLPEHLKWLLLHCSLFPSDYEFRKDELVQLWIAEGLIAERQIRTMEDTGSVYFNSLVCFGFFVPSRYDRRVDSDCLLEERDMVSPMSNYNGSNLLYKVNATTVSILDNTNGDYYFTAVNGKLDGASETTQHLTFVCKGIDNMTFGVLERFTCLRTLILLSGCGSSIKQVPRNFFLRLKLLRTLNLSGTFISELPSSVGNLKSLRYLDVSHTPITLLPESVDSLHNLQTLKLRGCIHFIGLPKGMKKLTSLRHIDLDIIQQLIFLPAHLGNLTNLQTLSAFLVGRDNGFHIGELKYLNELRGALCISRLENVSSMEQAKEAVLFDKKCLHKLELRWSNLRAEETCKEEEILESLQPHFGLKELRILFYGGSVLPTWISNPSFADLVAITLYKCTNIKLLPSIGELPALKFLYITEMNELEEINPQFFRNGSQVCPAFRKLKVLAVDVMLNLKEWMGVQIGDLPSLLKLTVHCCPKLASLPSLSCLESLKHLEISCCSKLLSLPSDGLPTSLESLIITDCPELKEQCRKGEGQDWGKILHVPRVWFDHQEVT